ncbi:MAG TPA: response regulator [Methanomassiliicoccales archaeon]|jgi:PAS domain S-box-containing protein
MELLYVDDEPALLELGKEFLELEPDVQVTTQVNPVEALVLLNDKHFDIIVSDYMMPEMTGLEFFKRLRIIGITTPFILFTGKGREEVVIEAMRHGVDFYIKKGGDAQSQFAELINAIRQCTARKEAEEALEHNARRFRTMIENQSEIIALSDLTGHLTFVSNSLRRILGYEPEDFIGKNVREFFIDPTEFDFRPRVGKPSMSPDMNFTMQARMRHKDGSPRFMEMKGQVLKKDGVMNEVLVNAYDITGRKQDERRISHLINVLKAIRQINKCITTETDPMMLLKKACDIAVERGYSTAWAVIFDDGRNPMRTVETGVGKPFEEVHGRLLNKVYPRCSGHILSGQDTIVNEVPQDTCPECPLNGYPHDHIHVAKPLVYGGNIFGQFSVTLSRELFSPDELSVLAEIAEDLSFALHHLLRGQENDEYQLAKVKMKKMFLERFTMMDRPTLVVTREPEGNGHRLTVGGASNAFLTANGFDARIVGMEVGAIAESTPEGTELAGVIDDVIRSGIPQTISIRSSVTGVEYTAFVFAPGADFAGVMLIPSVKAETSLSIGRSPSIG